eukprot:187725-Prorocentrum_minimum.AAC.1
MVGLRGRGIFPHVDHPQPPNGNIPTRGPLTAPQWEYSPHVDHSQPPNGYLLGAAGALSPGHEAREGAIWL